MNYEEKQLKDLKDRRNQYLKYAEDMLEQIEEIERVKKEVPEIGEFVGKFFISFKYNQIYVVLGPSLHHTTKEALPDKVEISHFTIHEGEDDFVYKGQYNYDIDYIKEDTEITEEQMNLIVKFWLVLSERGQKKIKDVVKTFKEEMVNYSKSVVDKA